MTKQQVKQRQHQQWLKRQVNIKKPDTSKHDLKVSEMVSTNPFFAKSFVNAFNKFNGGFNA